MVVLKPRFATRFCALTNPAIEPLNVPGRSSGSRQPIAARKSQTPIAKRQKKREFRTFNLGALLIAPMLFGISLGFAVSSIARRATEESSGIWDFSLSPLGFLLQLCYQRRWASC
jgi:hypothetical protein